MVGAAVMVGLDEYGEKEKWRKEKEEEMKEEGEMKSKVNSQICPQKQPLEWCWSVSFLGTVHPQGAHVMVGQNCALDRIWHKWILMPSSPEATSGANGQGQGDKNRGGNWYPQFPAISAVFRDFHRFFAVFPPRSQISHIFSRNIFPFSTPFNEFKNCRCNKFPAIPWIVHKGENTGAFFLHRLPFSPSVDKILAILDFFLYFLLKFCW